MELKHTLLLLAAISIFSFSSCEKKAFLDPMDDGSLTADQIFSNYKTSEGLLNDTYNSLIVGYYSTEGAMLASGCDEAKSVSEQAFVKVFNDGSLSPERLPSSGVWATCYAGIRKANMFLSKVDTLVFLAPAAYYTPEGIKTNNERRARLKGEAYFLKAMAYFELVKRWGGVPIVDQVLNFSDNLDLKRNTYQECVDFIVKQCDAAIALLPVVYDNSSTSRGRASKAAALALKARVLLYAASPLNNPANDKTKWEASAAVSNEIFKLTDYKLQGWYPNIFVTVYDPEILFASQVQNNHLLESGEFPIGYNGGNGSTNPTQEMVDAFEMNNGKAITDPSSGYDPQNPYKNRDARLGMTVHVDGADFKGRKVETYVGGQDGLDKSTTSTKTGYYLKKFCAEWVNPYEGNSTVGRYWIFFRLGESLLSYAEAMNEAYGPDADPKNYGMTARQAVNKVRSRVYMPGVLATTQDEMRTKIMNERRVELAFEEHRFWDVRRWKLGSQYFNKPIHGMRITKNGNSKTYTVFKVEDRVYSEKMNWLPIYYYDIIKQKNLEQTPGW